MNAETLALLADAIRAQVRCQFTADTMHLLGNGQDVMLSVAEAGVAAEAVVAALEGAGLVVVSRALLADLVAVAAYLSTGCGLVDVDPYPDARARRAMGALTDEVGLENVRDLIANNLETDHA